jgi:hypothetical protein
MFLRNKIGENVAEHFIYEFSAQKNQENVHTCVHPWRRSDQLGVL